MLNSFFIFLDPGKHCHIRWTGGNILCFYNWSTLFPSLVTSPSQLLWFTIRKDKYSSPWVNCLVVLIIISFPGCQPVHLFFLDNGVSAVTWFEIRWIMSPSYPCPLKYLYFVCWAFKLVTCAIVHITHCLPTTWTNPWGLCLFFSISATL